MIVRFDFEGGNEAVADVHDAGVFARTLHDEFAACGQAFEVNLAGFVGAVFAPHDGKNAELGDVRIAAENFLDARVFFGGDAVLGGDFGSDFDFGCGGGHYALGLVGPARASRTCFVKTRHSAGTSAELSGSA